MLFIAIPIVCEHCGRQEGRKNLLNNKWVTSPPVPGYLPQLVIMIRLVDLGGSRVQLLAQCNGCAPPSQALSPSYDRDCLGSHCTVC